MPRLLLPRLFAGVVGLALWAGAPNSAHAQLVPTAQDQIPPPASSNVPATVYQPLNHYYYYPYYYFPHSYWPAQGPKWPEPVGAAYMPPPAYMAYPPFKEWKWRYEAFEPQHYYRGFHFWLDQF
jgi:hypothetical protein